jgi:hypothetical protein
MERWNYGIFALFLDINDHMHGVVVNGENGSVIESNRITGENRFFLFLM